MKKLLSQISVLFLFVVFLTSCATTKSAAQSRKKKQSTVTQQQASTFDNQPAQEALIDAMKAKMLEDYEEAIKLFEKALKLDPANDASMYELAEIYYQYGDFDQALKYIKQAVQVNGTNKWYLLLYAETLSYKGQYQDAASVYEKIIKQYPSEVDVYFDWAFMLVKAEKYDDAIKVYDELENLIGLDENIVIQKERLYVRLGKVEKAAAEIRKLIDSDPMEGSYYKMLADLYEGTNMKDKAAKVYEELLAIDKDNPIALLYMADMYRLKGDQEKSFEYLKKAFSNPDLDIDNKVRILFPYLQQMLADNNDRKEDAFQLAQIIIEAHPDEAKAHAIYGDLLYQDKQMEEALEQYQQALELDSSVFEIWQQMFFIYSDLKKNEELEKITNTALDLYPSQPLVYFFNGIAKNQLKKYQEAVDILTIGEPLVVENPLLKAQMNATLGESYNYLEQYDLSDSAFEKSLKYDSDNAYTLNNYAYYLSLRGAKLERAKEMSAKSIKLVPDNSSFEDTYAWILYKIEDFSEAKKWIEKAIENGGSDSPVILEHYGDILFKLGEVDKAVANWQKAKSLGSDSELIGKKIADRKIYE